VSPPGLDQVSSVCSLFPASASDLSQRAVESSSRAFLDVHFKFDGLPIRTAPFAALNSFPEPLPLLLLSFSATIAGRLHRAAHSFRNRLKSECESHVERCLDQRRKFVIERSLDGTYFSQIAVAPANATSFVDLNVAGRRYYYRVAAANAAGSSYSPAATCTTR
jgi:hypothetical protein